MENEEIKAPEGNTPSVEEIKQELEAVKAEKEKLLSTQDEITKLQAELEKQKKELEELKNYKFPDEKSPVIETVAPQAQFENELEALKNKFDRVIYAVENNFPEEHPERLIFRLGDTFNGYSLNDGYMDYKQLKPEERTIDNLKKIFPKIF